jgi:hypothetical protein
MTNLASSFHRYVRSRAASDFQRRVAELSAHDELTRTALVAASREAGMHDISEATDDLLDLLLYYIRLALSDHNLSGGEMTSIRTIARLFQIEEGDLLARRGEEVAELVGAEMRHILLDNDVDTEEADRKVRLQEALGLSYDQFVELSRPLIEGAVAELLDRSSEAGEVNLDWMQRRISALDTVYQMDGLVDRQAAEALRTRAARRGTERDSERADRSITQDVRDTVWIRDQGRCTECGSEGRLSFDYIIPTSLGGSGALRNVQLLCEECASRKAARTNRS